MANLINEAEIRSTWAPIIEEATGINDSNKLAWMSTYCHNHKLYEDANIMSLTNNPGPMNLTGIGAVVLPTRTAQNGDASGYIGSGDKAPTLLPLAMQVAAQTIALDLVPVIPMAGPMGLLSYLDFVYEGGTILLGATAPTYIKSDVDAASFGPGSPVTSATYTKVGNSRIDGYAIYQVTGDLVAANVLADFRVATANNTAVVELVKALEDHIPGFTATTAVGNDPYATYAKPYDRATGERTADKLMGLSLFSKSVEAETFQVAAAVTREQVQDLKQFGVDAVAQVEAVLTNELTQEINDYILARINELALLNKSKSGTSLDLALDYTGTSGNTYGDINRRILTHILASANLIANRGRRGAGNFAVVDAKVASALQAVAGFVPNPIANTINQTAGAIYPVGSIAGINIYTDPRVSFNGYLTGSPSVETHRVIVGRKGDGNGAGLVFMPYLMAESVQTIAEGTMAPKVAVKSRFALVEAGFHPETMYYSFEVTGLEL
jgi:hypothetical protein